jgi:catalase
VKSKIFYIFRWNLTSPTFLLLPKTDQGIRNLRPPDAAAISSSEPDYAIRDLCNAIPSLNYPSWTMYVQVMTFEEAARVNFNPFDLTKIWSHSGRLVLNRNAENYFGQIEQLAFSPSHMIPGIEPSPYKMLQARLF